jgi:Fic family protein
VTVSSWVSYLQTIADTLQYLSETYEVMEKKHRSIRHLIEQKRVTAQEAAARRDWSDVDKLHRALHKTIEEEIATYDTMAGHASGFRDSLVRLGVRRPPSPPPLLRTHQLTRRRG